MVKNNQNNINLNQSKNNNKIIKKPLHRFQSTTLPQLSLEFFRQTIANKRESQQKVAKSYGFYNQSSLARFMWGYFIPKKQSTRKRYAAIFDVDISLFSNFCDEQLKKMEEEDGE